MTCRSPKLAHINLYSVIYPSSIMNNLENHLPLGYTAFEEPSITHGQVEVLFYPNIHSWEQADYVVQNYDHVDLRNEFHGRKTIYFGVKVDQGETVGVGSLRYNAKEGELSCLAVLPDHRRQGIGKWLIAERVRRAQELGVATLHIERLADTNVLASYYIDLGFTSASDHPRTTWFDFPPNLEREAFLTRTVQIPNKIA